MNQQEDPKASKEARQLDKVFSALTDIVALAHSARSAIEARNYMLARVYLRIIADEAQFITAETRLLD